MNRIENRSYHTVWMLLGLFIVVGAFSWTGDMGKAAMQALLMNRQGLMAGEVWRLVTYVFLTGDAWDLLFKVLVFYYIAAPLEAVWGTKRFLNVFMFSVVGGGLTAAFLDVTLVGGWAATMSLMLVHGFMFPESRLYLFLIIPVRVKTLAIVSTALYLGVCVLDGLHGLALFAGLFCGALYYFVITGTLPWARRARRKVAEVVANPKEIVRGYSTATLMEQARRIMRESDSGKPLSAADQALIEEAIQRAEAGGDMCSPYSFSPDNTICPPCGQFGRCLKRYVQTVEKEEPAAIG